MTELKTFLLTNVRSVNRDNFLSKVTSEIRKVLTKNRSLNLTFNERSLDEIEAKLIYVQIETTTCGRGISCLE